MRHCSTCQKDQVIFFVSFCYKDNKLEDGFEEAIDLGKMKLSVLRRQKLEGRLETAVHMYCISVYNRVTDRLTALGALDA